MRVRHLGLLPVGLFLGAAVLAACAYHNGRGNEAASDAGPTTPSGPQPQIGSVVTQAVPPPPISGGTLILTSDHRYAVAADSDRDQVYVVDLTTSALARTVTLFAGDEPGRLAEDAAGRVHVATRRGGDLVSIDLASGAIVARRRACAAPRGVAYDRTSDSVLVACSSGELVTFSASDRAAPRAAYVDSDLRDVVLVAGRIFLSRFRSAELLEVDATGAVLSRARPPSVDHGEPGVAWRTIATADGAAVAMVHQRAGSPAVSAAPGGYGDPVPCSSIVQTVVSRFELDGRPPALASAIANAVLPVDVALDARGNPAQDRFFVVAAGNSKTHGRPQLVGAAAAPPKDGGSPPAPPPGPSCEVVFEVGVAQALAPIAVAADASGRAMVQSREPAALFALDADGHTLVQLVSLSTSSRADTGHDIFHTDSGVGIACASCHAEGAEDGRVWTFAGLGPRRTPSLRGTVAGTAPYHWDGAMTDFAMLEHDVFEGRMSGPSMSPAQVGALASWVGAIPAPPPIVAGDAVAIARGKAIFEGSAACASCHSGAKLTNNATVDIGTGGAFQVPPLVGVAWRAPFMHDGCATTLRDRFTGCGHTQHGATDALASGDIDDLVAYLGSL